MIGYLRGNIIAERGSEVWMDVSGVGYRVKISPKLGVLSPSTSSGLDHGSEVELFIHTAVREDAITLYGFATIEELQLFEMLISVSGVGPKTGMDIVSAAGEDQIETAIRQANVNFFVNMKGIGKKSAQRIIIDLKNKIGSLKEVDLSAEDEDDVVFQALKQFGFKSHEIQLVLKQLDRSETEQEQIKKGLKLLGKSK